MTARMLGRALPKGCPKCRTEHVGPDCPDRSVTPRVARKVEKRAWIREAARELGTLSGETIGGYVSRLWRRGDVSLFVAPWPAAADTADGTTLGFTPSDSDADFERGGRYDSEDGRQA